MEPPINRHPRRWIEAESFANDSDGNVGGGYSPGANDGVYSKDGGYNAPAPKEDRTNTEGCNNTDNTFDGLHGEEDKIQFDDIDDDVSSQPAVPFVGMFFDHPDGAQKFYNEYAFKKGFGTRIAASRNSQRRGPPVLIKRVFECVHSRKTVDNTKLECTSESIASVSTSGSKQAGVAMEVTDSRQRKRLLRHDCKAHMIVALREGRWKVTYFVEEHTHEMLQSQERTRYYRSHRNVPEEDYQMIVALHNRNITTSDIMGILADEHGGNPRTLPYVKRDVTNLRAKLREGMKFKDMALTMEYFHRRQAESPSFFFSNKVNPETNEVEALFWVDGRTRALYPKYKDRVFFDTTFYMNQYNMPFAPIVGVNNKLQTIVLGCALVPNEQAETFKWVFEQWMLAMDNHGQCTPRQHHD
ncbi:hypothetical protein ACQ4PT_007753 [Festuca glaucescens]